MQTLRNAKLIAGLVLVWFALFLGVATAATVIQPSGVQMVCSGVGGMKVVDTNSPGTSDPGGDAQVSTGLDCPLCASVSMPLSVSTVPFNPPSDLAHALQPVAAAHIASVTAPPLPSRGPPSAFH